MKKTAIFTAAMITGLVMTAGTQQVQAAGRQPVQNANVKVVSGKDLQAALKSDNNTLKNYLQTNVGKNCVYVKLSCLPGDWNGGNTGNPGGSQPENKPGLPENNTPENKPGQPENNTPENKPGQPENNTPENNKPGTPDTETPDSEDSTQQEHAYVRRIAELVNEERAKAGLSPLTLQKNISAAAQVRAVETETSFSHTRPNGTNFSTALKEAGVSYRGSGENIAWGQKTPEQVMQGWMNSPGHRANILNAKYTSIGVGYYQNTRGVNYWTQLFTY